MTLSALLDAQDIMFRAYVRNMMFFATLPYHVAQEMRRHGACEAGTQDPV
jgi:hypothetical protein